ncbi:hypothetical protein SRHO_G00081670 [Serrasalmus rhombeus]
MTDVAACLRSARSGKMSHITLRMNILNHLMAGKDYLDEVKGNMFKFNEYFAEFKQLHTSYVEMLNEEERIKDDERDGDQESVLPIVPVKVKAAKGSHVLQVYVLLDPGSSATFCSEELMSRLHMKVKQLQQELCHKGFGWDEPLPQSVSDWWMECTSSLEKIKSFSVPHCLKPHCYGVTRCAELHHFSDASERGYGSVSYIRQVNEQDVVHVTFVLGKSRVPPLKAITIPRLELAAAALLVKVDRMLRRELHVDLKASVFWTESQTVLKYIANDSARFKTFVANRVLLI